MHTPELISNLDFKLLTYTIIQHYAITQYYVILDLAKYNPKRL